MVAHSHPLGGWTKTFYYLEEQQEKMLSSLAFFLSACQGPFVKHSCPTKQIAVGG